MTTFRAMTAGDAVPCVGVGLEAFGPVYSSMEGLYGSDLFKRLRPDWQKAESERIESLCTAAGKQGRVAVGDGPVSGFIVLTPDRATGLGSVDIVAVRPAAQRKGLGSALIEQALAGLRDSGMAFGQAHVRNFPGHEPIRNALERAGFSSMRVQPVPYYLKLTDQARPLASSGDIRRIEADDVADCVRFGTETFRPVYSSFAKLHGQDFFSRMWPDWEETQAAYMESACRSTEKETWIYERDGRIAGFTVLTTDEHMIGEIELLSVDPGQQGHGIGTALNRFALGRLRQLGMAYAIVATADDPGHAAARRSYAKVGFAPMPIQWNLLYRRL